MPLLLGFGGKPHHGKDTAALAIAEEFPGTKIFSVSDFICEELGLKRSEVKDASILQKHSHVQTAGDKCYWGKKMLAAYDSNPTAPVIICTNVRRWEEADLYRKHGVHLVRFIRLNKNGSPYIARDRDMNDPLETDLDFFNWDYRITVKTGQTDWLKSQAVALACSLLGENAATTKQNRPHGRGVDVATIVKHDIDRAGVLLREPLWPWRKLYPMIMVAAASILAARGLKGDEIARQMKEDIEARVRMGEKKYGERLTTHNGREADVDCYQELLDAANYGGQKDFENEHPELAQ